MGKLRKSFTFVNQYTMKGLDEHDGHPLARRAFKSARPAVCVCPARGSYGTGGVVRVVGTLMEPAHAAVPRQEIAHAPVRAADRHLGFVQRRAEAPRRRCSRSGAAPGAGCG